MSEILTENKQQKLCLKVCEQQMQVLNLGIKIDFGVGIASGIGVLMSILIAVEDFYSGECSILDRISEVVMIVVFIRIIIFAVNNIQKKRMSMNKLRMQIQDIEDGNLSNCSVISDNVSYYSVAVGNMHTCFSDDEIKEIIE